jgi:tRNA A37 methylthiotransferase MiaB
VERTSFKKNQSLVGSIQEVLVEKKGVGRTRTHKTVKYPCRKDETGKFRNIRIKSAGSWVLLGEAVD